MSSNSDWAHVATNLQRIRDRIEAAIGRRGPGRDVTLIGVTKHQPDAALEAALAAGLGDFGENYAQALAARQRAFDAPNGHPAPTWHFIGGLQRNKVKLVVGRALIHTVDRPSLLLAIDKQAAELGIVQPTLVEINTAGEAQKAGTSPATAEDLLDRYGDLQHVTCVGLMAIPPAGPDVRRHFRDLAALRDRLAAKTRPAVQLWELSMGMSADFEEAIEEGATMVRLGTAIFGARRGS